LENHLQNVYPFSCTFYAVFIFLGLNLGDRLGVLLPCWA
jgi:hypothetical protein